MARPLRIEFPGAAYHVTSRGNARNPIFINDWDRKEFLSILDSIVRRCNWLCHGYCLMDNHYHILIETPEGNLSQGMRQLNGVYTQKFNWKNGRTGHVFQGRFKAILIEKESYLLEVSRYVLLNPVRAQMVERPEEWPWSNYAATVGMTAVPGFLTVDWILGCFADREKEARECFREFINNADPSVKPLDKAKGQLILGGEGFERQFSKILSENRDIGEVPIKQRYASRPPLTSLVPLMAMAEKGEREQEIYHAYTDYGYSLKEIAEHLGIHYGTVSKMIKRVEQKKVAKQDLTP